MSPYTIDSDLKAFLRRHKDMPPVLIVVLTRDISRRFVCNGREYPREMMEREMQRFCREGQVGRLAQSPELAIEGVSSAAFKVQETWLVGDEIHGEVRLLNTPGGAFIRRYMQNDGLIAFSTQGTGMVRDDGRAYDYELTGLVAIPGPFKG